MQFTRDNLCYYRSNRSIKAGYIVNDLAPSHSSCHYLPLPLPPLSVYSTPQKTKVLYFTQQTVDSFSRNLPQPVSDAIAAPSLYSDSDIVATYVYICIRIRHWWLIRWLHEAWMHWAFSESFQWIVPWFMCITYTTRCSIDNAKYWDKSVDLFWNWSLSLPHPLPPPYPRWQHSLLAASFTSGNHRKFDLIMWLTWHKGAFGGKRRITCNIVRSEIV